MNAYFDWKSQSTQNTKVNLYLTEEDIKNIKELRHIIKKCDCRYAGTIDNIALPLLDSLIDAVGVSDEI
jgi:hypothetical protein